MIAQIPKLQETPPPHVPRRFPASNTETHAIGKETRFRMDGHVPWEESTFRLYGKVSLVWMRSARPRFQKGIAQQIKN